MKPTTHAGRTLAHIATHGYPPAQDYVGWIRRTRYPLRRDQLLRAMSDLRRDGLLDHAGLTDAGREVVAVWGVL